MPIQNIVIIGNGIAGTTAALGIRTLSDANITIISEESPYPFSRTALMYVFMGQLSLQHTHLYPDSTWQEQNIQLLKARVKTLDRASKSVLLDDGKTLSYDQLILATGSMPLVPECEGIDLPGVRPLYHLSDLEYLERHINKETKHAVIVGGGLIGIELAEMLFSRGIKVSLLIRESSYWNNVLPAEESEMVSQHIEEKGINILAGETLAAILGDHKTTGIRTQSGKEIACDWVGITIGVKPNVSAFSNSGLSIQRGFVVNEQLRTNDPAIFAIGDCAELQVAAMHRKPIEAVWYTAKKMGQVAAANVCGQNLRYEQGLWYNSARFFELEYQVYGHAPNAFEPPYHSYFFKEGKGQKSIRIIYHEDGYVVGFLAMGYRLKQAVCEAWIHQKTSLDFVLAHFALAGFDPEFSVPYRLQALASNNELDQKNNTSGSVPSFLKFLPFLRKRS